MSTVATTTTAPRDPGYVSEADFGADWPLTIPEATLRCVPASAVILVTSKGTYAVNGLAKGQAAKNGWKEIEEIWREHPTTPGLRVDIGPLIDLGLDLC
jgi:hypothetical protein